MEKIFIRLLIIAFVFTAFSCASKRLTKKGQKHEAAGLYTDAAEFYYQALLKKDDNIDAKLGLKKAGQIVLDGKLGEFNKAYNMGNSKDAVYNYLESEKYFNKVKSVNIELVFPPHYKEYYNEVKNEHLNKQYKEGVRLLNEEKFAESEKIFQEILKIESKYKDVKDLIITARYEPIYRDAKNNIIKKKYRTAYYAFDNIIKGTGGYKDSEALKQDALKKGLMTIAILPFNSKLKRNDIVERVRTVVERDISKLDNPFVKIIDRTYTDKIIQEQELNLSGLTSNAESIEVGKILGAKTFLSATITKFAPRSGSLQKSKERGYVKKIIKYKDKETGETKTKTEYNKVSYYEYEQVNSVKIEFQFKLISAETGEVLLSEYFTKKYRDKVHYARFKGDSKNLVPGYWESLKGKSSKDRIEDNRKDVNRLHRLLKASSKIKSTEKLTEELVDALAKFTADKIDVYNPDKQ